MPLYEYYCPHHGKFDVIQHYDVVELPCPQCKTVSRRQISLPARPIFHGKGFYETDYKGKKDEPNVAKIKKEDVPNSM